MNKKQRAEMIRKSKSWLEKLQLANDEIPGTEFDRDIEEMIEALRWYQTSKGSAKEIGKDLILKVGYAAADAARRGDSKFFRDFATAIDDYFNHIPYPDKLRAAIVQFCLPDKSPYQMRDIVKHLTSLGWEQSDNLTRQVYRICDELNFTIKGRSGRPR